MPTNIQNILKNFHIFGDFISCESFGTGHIHDTYAVTFNQSGTVVRYLLQKLNTYVFKSPVQLMENFLRVTAHIRNKWENEGANDISRKTLTLVTTWDNLPYYRDEKNNYYRVLLFIENTYTLDVITSTADAFKGAQAFGLFQKMLSDIKEPRLHETIPNFHNTPKRFEALEEAIRKDSRKRALQVKKEIDFAFLRKPIVSRLTDLQKSGKIPERITHNDNKFNNVLLDKATNEGLCVIDLDTVMPGLSLYDFGDMVRTVTSPTAEDETDLTQVKMQLPMFEALAQGYLSAAGDFLNDMEKQLLPFSGKLITFEQGIRFLTDHINGDVYYKTSRENQNLDRTRTQFKLLESIEAQEDQMNRFVEKISKRSASKE
jgi:hypothetical protein